LDENLLQQIIQVLNEGGIIIYPTETAYGLGCDGLNEEAIKKIYSIKKRNQNHPLPVIISTIEMANRIAYMNPLAKKLIETFHPGPLVIALPKKAIIPDIVNPKGIAFRISRNKIIHQIVSEFNNPIISTSANLSGNPAPYSIDEIKNQLDLNLIDIILDSGTLPVRQPSTIVDFQLKPSPQIIREGEISAKQILETIETKKELRNNHLQILRK
jgi:L-threonylcarbamoyladenylate synthase